MKIKKDSLTAKIKNLSLKTNTDFNDILKNYFFDCLLKRLCKSDYSKNLIFKGGFLLSHIFGLDKRTTDDMDFSLTNQKLSYENIYCIFDSIIKIDAEDDVTFEINDISPIRKSDIYGGFRVKITGHLDNIKEHFYIDVATGDIITPFPIPFIYNCLFSNEEIVLKAYTIETIISEKLHAVLSRKDNNGRAKDFYDLYVFFAIKNQLFDVDILKSAFNNTCKHRGESFSKSEAFDILDKIKHSAIMQSYWNKYCKRKHYARGIAFIDTIEQIEKLLNIIYH